MPSQQRVMLVSASQSESRRIVRYGELKYLQIKKRDLLERTTTFHHDVRPRTEVSSAAR